MRSVACQRSWNETAPTPRSSRAGSLPRAHRAQRARPVSGRDLDFVAAAGLEHELAGHAPGRALALGHEAAEAPVARIGDAPVELHHAPAGRLHLVGQVRADRVGRRPGGCPPVGEQRGEQARRRRVRVDAVCAFGLRSSSAERRLWRISHCRSRTALASSSFDVAFASWPSRGVGSPTEDHADREGGVLVGEDQDAPGRGRGVAVTQGAQRVRARRERRHREAARAVRQGHEAHGADAAAEERDDRAGKGGAVSVLDRAEDAAGRALRACGAERPEGWPGSRRRARAVSKRCPRPIEYMKTGSTLPAGVGGVKGRTGASFRAHMGVSRSRAVL